MNPQYKWIFPDACTGVLLEHKKPILKVCQMALTFYLEAIRPNPVPIEIPLNPLQYEIYSDK